jgi:hypothetical protein
MYICTKCDALNEDDWANGVARKEAESVTDSLMARLIEIKPPPDDEAYMTAFRKGVLETTIEKCRNICDDCYIAIEATFPLYTSVALAFVEKAIQQCGEILACTILTLPENIRAQAVDTHVPIITAMVKTELARRGSGKVSDAGQAIVDEIQRLISETLEEKGNLIDPEAEKLLADAQRESDALLEHLKEIVAEEESDDGDAGQPS